MSWCLHVLNNLIKISSRPVVFRLDTGDSSESCTLRQWSFNFCSCPCQLIQSMLVGVVGAVDMSCFFSQWMFVVVIWICHCQVQCHRNLKLNTPGETTDRSLNLSNLCQSMVCKFYLTWCTFSQTVKSLSCVLCHDDISPVVTSNGFCFEKVATPTLRLSMIPAGWWGLTFDNSGENFSCVTNHDLVVSVLSMLRCTLGNCF